MTALIIYTVLSVFAISGTIYGTVLSKRRGLELQERVSRLVDHAKNNAERRG